MNNFDSCVNYKSCTDCVIISCKLGLWSVKGPYDVTTVNQAEQKYKQFKAAGKYKNLLKEKTYGSIKIKK